MNYRDFYTKENALAGGKGDNTSESNVDPQQLEMGVKVEMEHTHDPKIAREIAIDHLTEDPQYYSRLGDAGLVDEPGADVPSFGGLSPIKLGPILNVPSRVRPVSIAKIVSPATCFAAGTPTQKSPGGDAVSSMPADKEPITVAGKTDPSVAQKSVGGQVVPGEGQEQGGPNTQGNIAGTPREISTKSECSGPNTKGSVGGTPSSKQIGLQRDLIKGCSTECSGMGIAPQSKLGQFRRDEYANVEPEGSGKKKIDVEFPEDEDEEGEDVAIHINESMKSMLKDVIKEVVMEIGLTPPKITEPPKDLEPAAVQRRASLSGIFTPEMEKQLLKLGMKKDASSTEASDFDYVKDYKSVDTKLYASINFDEGNEPYYGWVVSTNNLAQWDGGYKGKGKFSRLLEVLKRWDAWIKERMRQGDMHNYLMQEKKEKWIQKAVNPKHKGYCTPMTKPTCTPKRKALAKRFKSGDLSEAGNINLDVSKITDVEVGGVNPSDYPDFSDAYIVSAVYPAVENPRHGNPNDWRELTDEELDWVNNEHPEIANQAAHGHMQGEGDRAFDSFKDSQLGLEENKTKKISKKAGKKLTAKFNKNPKDLKKAATQTISKLQKEAAYISRKINEGRELSDYEKNLIKEIIQVRIDRLMEDFDADKSWEHASEYKDAMLDQIIDMVVKYRSKKDTLENLVMAISSAAEDKLGMRYVDDESIEAQVKELMKKYPARY